MANFKVPISINNLVAVPNETDLFEYDFVCSHTPSCKTGTQREVPQENQGSDENISKFLIGEEIGELDNGVLAIIVIADQEN